MHSITSIEERGNIIEAPNEKAKKHGTIDLGTKELDLQQSLTEKEKM